MLLLASKSPRRRELLKLMDLPYRIVDIKDVDEKYPENMSPKAVPEYLSRLKSDIYKENIGEEDILITADTMVILGDEIIGKPKDKEDAKRMLGKLADNTHSVITGVTLTSLHKSCSFSVETEVEFSPLSKEEIDYYVETYHPLDKAGAYGIQDWIGVVAVKGIKGSYYNVVGLPVHQLYYRLRKFTK